MACRNTRRWFVINYIDQTVYAYTRSGKLGWVCNVPWVRPFLFFRFNEALQVALKNNCSARYWPGKLYTNSKDDNRDFS